MAPQELREAIERHVLPGMHLHFPSTPSRANAAIRALACSYRGRDPRFLLSTSGFHSTAHLLALLRLGRTYLACFFGDNYPTPRPNGLYTSVAREGAELQQWTLLSYTAALQAGARGHRYALAPSLQDSDVGRDLRRAGQYLEVPDPARPETAIGLVRALRPDISFVHAPLGTKDGALIAFPPYGEGYWSAVSATTGVIATVEEIVDASSRDWAGSTVLPAGHALAVCALPGGAQPQQLYTPAAARAAHYRDDPYSYGLWRRLATDRPLFEDFTTQVLEAPDPEAAYWDYIRRARTSPATDPGTQPALATSPVRPDPQEATVLRAAAAIVRAVSRGGHRRILAGIGQSFLAARLAHHTLARTGLQLPVMVETGLYDVDCGPLADSFLLGHRNVAQAGRLTSIEDVLGSWACGAQSGGCLAVVGAAQADPHGHVNSTRLRDGTQLVGSGGASDLAAHADEVIVLTTCRPDRLVPAVDHITSTGRAVRTIATDLCTLHRDDPASTIWTATDLAPDLVPDHAGDLAPDQAPDHASAQALRRFLCWPDIHITTSTFRPTPEEVTLLRQLTHERAD